MQAHGGPDEKSELQDWAPESANLVSTSETSRLLKALLSTESQGIAKKQTKISCAQIQKLPKSEIELTTILPKAES